MGISGQVSTWGSPMTGVGVGHRNLQPVLADGAEDGSMDGGKDGEDGGKDGVDEGKDEGKEGKDEDACVLKIRNVI